MKIIMRKPWKKRALIWMAALLVLAGTPFLISYIVEKTTKEYFISDQQASSVKADCILILGAGLLPDGTPNRMLQDRLDKGIALYQSGAAPKILISGDNGQEEYDEVNAMKDYILKAGIKPEDIFMDHAGFSTYESMYRARDIFRVQKAIVITQKYHQYRALYIARGLGLEAYGVVSEPRSYNGQIYRELREILARNKDFFKVMLKPEPTYLGETIPINGSGLKSHD